MVHDMTSTQAQELNHGSLNDYQECPLIPDSALHLKLHWDPHERVSISEGVLGSLVPATLNPKP